MQGGAGSDTLTFSGGSGSLHASVVSQGLKGWERVVIESGAALSGDIRLAEDSDRLTFSGASVSGVGALIAAGANTDNTLAFNGVSGAIAGASLSGWETVEIGDGSRIAFGTGAHTVSAGSLKVIGTLNVGDDSDITDALTVPGNFDGGGTVVLDANFAATGGGSDTLTISGSATGTTTVDVSRVGSGDLTAGGSLERIDGVIRISGTALPGAFFAVPSSFGEVGYRLEHDSANGEFDLVRFFTNGCNPVPGVAGAYVCSGTHLIGTTQALDASGAAPLHVTLNSETPVDTDANAFTLTQPGSAGMTFTQSATGLAVRGALSGIVAHNSGGGSVSINVNGAVTGVAGDGIRALDGAGGAGITITAASVSGSAIGIAAISSGTGDVSVKATGSVTGTGDAGVLVAAESGVGAVTVSAATVAGADGVEARHFGTGALRIETAGSVTAAAGGIGIYALAGATAGTTSITAAAVSGGVAGIKAVASGTGAISVAATGRVFATTGDGILVDHDGSGGASISVSGAVTGGSGANVAAIRTDVGTGTAMITLNSGAIVGSGTHNAIIGSSGNTTLTVNTGAAIAGAVRLGAGADVAVFAGGVFGSVTQMDGGAGNDTLRFAAGSGSLHASVQASGLENWETVRVESGAALTGSITLAASSRDLVFDGAAFGDVTEFRGGGAGTLTFRNVSGALPVGRVENWNALEIGAGASLTVNGSVNVGTAAAATLRVNGGTLSTKDAAADDSLTLDGNFQGGGVLAIDVNFAARSADTLVIGGTVSGTTSIGVTQVNSAAAAAELLDPIEVISVAGGGLTSRMFSLAGGPLSVNQRRYGLEVSADGKKLYLSAQAGCYETASGSDHYVCRGAITTEQRLSAQDAQTLKVDAWSNASFDTSAAGGSALALSHSGAGGIDFTQSATGQDILGAVHGIHATNAGGGSVSVTTTGSVTGAGASGDGIRASSDASGLHLLVSAATVAGGGHGIWASNSGTGSTSVLAGSVTGGTAAAGIRAYNKGASGLSASSLTIAAASVAGSVGVDADNRGGGALVISVAAVAASAGDGLRARNRNGGHVSVTATGAVSASGDGSSAIRAENAAGGTGIWISAGTASGDGHGIRALSDGTGVVSVRATGSVSGRGAGASDGAGIHARSGRAGAGVTVTATNVSGAVHGIRAISSNTAPVSVAVSGRVTGGAGGAAIRTDAFGRVRISLASGAAVGAEQRRAILDGDGAATVEVASGARVIGAISLGRGDDSVTFASGGFDRVERLDGGVGDDALTFAGGSGSLSARLRTTGLENWERITVMEQARLSGEIALASTSRDLIFDGANFADVTRLDGGANGRLLFKNVSGALVAERLTGWQSVEIASDASLTVDGTQTLAQGAAATFSLKGALSLADGAADDRLAVGGNFAGGGRLNIDVDFAATQADHLSIGRSVSGATTISVSAINDAAPMWGGVTVVSFTGTGSGIASSMFSLAGGPLAVGGVRYDLEVAADGRAVRFGPVAGCHEVGTGTDSYICVGAISREQRLSASESRNLNVDAWPSATVDTTSGADSAFTLTHTGSGGIAFTQSATGLAIRGGGHGIHADNRGGGAVSISTTGTVAGLGGSHAGIRAVADAASSDMTISAATVTGGGHGIWVDNSGTGRLHIAAGRVTGGADGVGIRARNAGSAGSASSSLSVSAGAVAGGTGIDAANSGGGGLSVTAAAVSASAGHGIRARNANGGAMAIAVAGAVSGGSAGAAIDAQDAAGGAGISILVGSATGGGDGIRAVSEGGGAVSIRATGAVGGRSGTGIHAMAGSGGTGVTVTAAAASGGVHGIRIVSAGGGAVSVSATGAVEGGGSADGAGIHVTTGSAGSGVEITAADVAGAVHGIRVESGNAGAVTVSVSGAVTGGAAGAAIGIDAPGAIEIGLASGASVGASGATAIRDGVGNAQVSVAPGAAVAGNISLGGGADSILFANGGFDLGAVLDGGTDAGGTDGSVDVLDFAGQSSGSLTAANLRGWETIRFGAGTRFSLLGRQTLNARSFVALGALSMGDKAADDALEVSGDMTGGGLLAVDVDFAAGISDTLRVGGSVDGDATTVMISDVTGGARPSGEAITVISVLGEVDADAFKLASNGRVVAGPFVYELEFDFIDEENAFVLTGESVEDGSTGRGAALAMAPDVWLRTFARAPAMSERRADRRPLVDRRRQGLAAVGSGLIASDDSPPAPEDTRLLGKWRGANAEAGSVARSGSVARIQPDDSNVRLASWVSAVEWAKEAWVRVIGESRKLGKSRIADKIDISGGGAQAGFDLLSRASLTGTWTVTATAQFGQAGASATTRWGSGKLDAQGHGLGAIFNWQGYSGAYLDFQAQYNRISTDFTASDESNLADGHRAKAALASIEFGANIDVAPGFSLVPQLQISRGLVDGGELRTPAGLEAKFGTDSSFIGRLGVAAELSRGAVSGRLTGNLIGNAADAPDTHFGDVSIAGEKSTLVEIGFGASLEAGEHTTLFLDGSYDSAVGGGDSEEGYRVNAGARWAW